MARFPQHTAYKTHAELLASAADRVGYDDGIGWHEARGQALDDLFDAGWYVSIGVQPQANVSYAGKPEAQIVNRDLGINLASGVGEDPWDALARVLRWGSERATELNV